MTYHLGDQDITVNSVGYIMKSILPADIVSKVGSLCWVGLQAYSSQPLQPVYYQLQQDTINNGSFHMGGLPGPGEHSCPGQTVCL